jgi:hypothetical protein
MLRPMNLPVITCGRAVVELDASTAMKTAKMSAAQKMAVTTAQFL